MVRRRVNECIIDEVIRGFTSACKAPMAERTRAPQTKKQLMTSTLLLSQENLKKSLPGRYNKSCRQSLMSTVGAQSELALTTSALNAAPPS
jgi:hypothetical protein